MVDRFVKGISFPSIEMLYLFLLAAFVGVIVWHIYLTCRIHSIRELRQTAKEVKRSMRLSNAENWYLSRRQIARAFDGMLILFIVLVSFYIEGAEYFGKDIFFLDGSMVCIWFIFSILGCPRVRPIR